MNLRSVVAICSVRHFYNSVLYEAIRNFTLGSIETAIFSVIKTHTAVNETVA